MKELLMATDTRWEDIFIKVLRGQNKPLTKRGLRTYLKRHNVECDNNKLGVLLYQMCNKGVLKKVKYPKFTSFYSLPEWVDEKTGIFKKEMGFNIVYGEFKNKPK